jgi:hypothetical protein
MLKRRRVVALLFAAAATAALSLTVAPASHADTVTGHFRIMSRDHALCVQQPAALNVEGLQLIQGPCSTSNLWDVIPLGDGTVHIVSASPNHFCMRARANADFSPVDSFGCTGVSNDVWTVTPVSGVPLGTEYQIKSDISTGGHPCLDVNDDSDLPGAPIDVFHCGNNNMAQIFFIG